VLPRFLEIPYAATAYDAARGAHEKSIVITNRFPNTLQLRRVQVAGDLGQTFKVGFLARLAFCFLLLGCVMEPLFFVA
jgi:hypothetical protein